MNQPGTMWAIVCVIFLAAAAGCGDDGTVGPLGTLVGGPCVNHGSCAEGASCLTKKEYPDGVCTVYCKYNDHCPFGSVCVDKEGGICLQSCDTRLECRGGYDCKGMKRTDKLGEALVCIKD